MLFGYDQGVMSGLFSAGQFALDFPVLAEVLPGAPADAQSSPSNPQFDSNIQGAVTAVSGRGRRNWYILYAYIGNRSMKLVLSLVH